MIRPLVIAIGLLAFSCPAILAVEDEPAGLRKPYSKEYKALRLPSPAAAGTWAILKRDGATRDVGPYLSSLALGEAGTGIITSPDFTLDTETIRFTIRGHDGQQGNQGENFLALIDPASGKVLRKTTAPGSDALQPQSWDVKELRGRTVRIEAHDGNAAGAFAWLGIGELDAGQTMRPDFSSKIPEGWTQRAAASKHRTEIIDGGVPFLHHTTMYTAVPTGGVAEIACGFPAKRLFVLGCTVTDGRPLQVYGTIEIVYRGGSVQRVPLMYGYTLDGEAKLLSPSPTMFIHPSGNRFQHYLVIRPKLEVIEKIRLVHESGQPVVPRLTAITCETPAPSENLLPLPDSKLSADEQQWIRSHTISDTVPPIERIKTDIRRAHKMK